MSRLDIAPRRETALTLSQDIWRQQHEESASATMFDHLPTTVSPVSHMEAPGRGSPQVAMAVR